MGDTIFNIISIIPIIFISIFAIIFVVVFVFGIIMAVKGGKRVLKSKDISEKFLGEKTEENFNQNELVECKYCGMKNKKGETRCSGCNAKL